MFEDVPAIAAVTYTDNCAGTVDFDFNETILPGDCAHNFTITRTWTAVDFAGHSTQFVQTINVNDNVAPTWTSVLPQNTAVQCGEDVQPATLTASDNCSGDVSIEFSETLLPGAGPNDGATLTRTWTATDVCGNAIVHTQVVTILDTQAPALQNLPQANVGVVCSEDVPAIAAVTYTDNCAGTVDFDFNETILPGDCAHNFTITRTWTAVDFAGHSTQFVQTINVNDNVAPTWTSALPQNTAVQCGEDVQPATLTASDNCSGDVSIEFSETLLPGAGPNDGATLTRTWTATDVCGNAIVHTQVVTILDTQAPGLQNLPQANVDVACATDVPAVAAVIYTDNCAGTIDFDFTEVEIPGACVNQFQVIRTWTAVDFAGNSTVFVQTITVSDTEAPELYAKPLRRHYQCIDEVEIAPYQFATDNCGIATIDFAETENPGVCPSEVIIERRWVAYDLCGNSSVWEQEIHVLDTIAPVLRSTPVNRTYACAEDIPVAPSVQAEDNCDIVFVDFAETTEPGSCPNQYTITRRWYAYDVCGNTAEHWQTITVNDSIAPTWTSALPADITVQCGEAANPSATLTASDNCTTPVDIEFSETLLPGAGPNDGATLTRIWTATDVCGNAIVHTQVVTILDTQAPTLNNLPQANVSVVCSENVPAIAAVTYTDNCQGTVDFDFNETILPGDCAHNFTITRTWTAVDFAGNSAQFVQTINVNDNVAPTWTSALPQDATIQCGEQVQPATLTASDNCSGDISIEFNETLLPGAGPNDGSILTRTWTATDVCGNSIQHTQVVTILDTQAPTLNNLPQATVSVVCSENVPAIAAVTYTDNCAGTVDFDFNETILPGDCAHNFTITRTWTAVDFAGNSTQFVQTIHVNDNVAPTWTSALPQDATIQCGEQVQAATLTASDNCSGAVLIEFNETLLPGAGPNDGSILTRTWTATDVCGNAIVHTQVVTILDTQAPTLNNLPQANVSVVCSENVPAIAAVTYTDNCQGTVDFDFNETILPGDCAHNFTITRTWTAVDFAGNSTQFVQTINVNDNVAPTWTSALPQNATIQCGETVPAVATMTASDNCSGDVLIEFNETLLPGAGPNDGSILTRTWTATDVCGNSIQYVQTIAITDTQAPVLANLPASVVTVACSEDVPAIAAVTYTDNCAGTVTFDFSETTQAGSCPNNFTVTRIWTAVDFAGNSTQFVQTINVNDDVAPVLSCPANASAQCTVDEIPVYDNLAEFNTAGGLATDNCDLNGSLFGLMSQTQSGNVYTRIYRATDLCGNTGTCAQTITVLDTQVPTFVNCPANITVGNDVDKCGANVVFSTPIADDNCGAVTVTQSAGLAGGSLFPVGATTVTFVAADPTGNTTTCQFVIEVTDMQTPTAVCENITVHLNASGVANVVAAQIGGGSTDNCPAAMTLTLSQTAFNCSNVGNNNVTLTVTDGAGNTAICNATVLVRDLLPPTFTCPAPQTVNGCDGLVPDLVSLITNAADNCGVASITQNPVAGTDFGNANGQSVNVTITVTDVNGNVATCIVPVSIVDNVPPVFTNCPTAMIMIGNDVDQCSGKLNWSVPVATDNCVLFSVVQISGPASGTVVPVGQPQTVTYRAFDAAGNSSTCSFQVQVVDTQNPAFDADIVMPSNVTVECDAVPAPFVLTNDDVHDNCTASSQLVLTFTEVRTDGNCLFNYTLTRTWRVTDQAGNQLVHTQIVTVRDTKAPTAICQNATVTLDKAGNVSITAAQINNGSFDNCTAQGNLTLTVAPSAFTCANLGANVVTLTVTDQCGNSATCTATVTVLEGIGPCAPQFSATTSCLNNATTMDNGQFIDQITVKSLAMQTWTVSTNSGLFAANSPAPPAAPTGLPTGTALTAGTADGIDNDGDGQVDEADEMVFYTLRGVHVEAVGYTITVQNNLGQTGTISNKGFYPTPYFINLDGPFCVETPPFAIEVGETYGAQGTVTGIMVNGVATNTFNAAQLGIGFHTVMATFDAGSATTNLVINGQLVGGTNAEALADPGCQQKITQIVQVVGTPAVIICNDLVHVSLNADCIADITPDDVLEGTYACFDDYSVVLTYPAGTNSYNPPNRVDATHIGKTLNYMLVHAQSGNVCWGKVKVEDKLAPILTCPADITIACSENTGVSHTGNIGISDCSSTTTQVDDTVVNNGDCANPRAVITRTFFVTDQWGNQSACTQTITVLPFDLDNVVFPADVTLNCDAIAGNPTATAPANAGSPSINGASIVGSVLCNAKVNFTDTKYDGCEGSYTILRTWSVLSDCLPVGAGNPATRVQRIEVKDSTGPQFDCPSDVTVSVDPFGCCATAPLPSVIVSEGCSAVKSLEAKVTGVDPATGNVITFTVTGTLGDFAGNNYWTPDTLAIFPYTNCLPIGIYTVTYTAADGCGNISTCQFEMTIEDLVPPVVACDEFTQVALGANGEALVNASTFDDGSYDNCAPVSFKARRMNINDCQTDTLFHDQVKFCCSDINDTITVVLRVYDIPVPTGTLALDAYDAHYNDCMVQVFVEDKIKPICNAPAHVTVSCESFDPTLWAYGFATAVDNCCLDTITETRNISLFDTVCNRGTITRTFRVFDCGGNSTTCTQRVTATYEQDYFVRFPDDVIVTVCDGTSNYSAPTFFGEDCELLGVSHEDEVFTVVPDACFKIERTWTIINWCTYNPNAGCIEVPNPNPNVITNAPQNLPGPIVSPVGTPAPWNPTTVAVSPGVSPTNYATFWSANANCYKYKQIIKVIDTQKPIIENCPAGPDTVCDLTANNAQLWNEMYWWDATIAGHDLCEGPTDLTITATDLCSDSSVNIRYLLFLDLDGDGTMETVINSNQTGIAGLGWNAVPYNNVNGPVSIRAFDQRPVPANQKYGFALQTTTSGDKRTASVRWNTQQTQGTYVIPELPYGNHKIKWFVEDGCGNESVCEYTFEVKDCKKPTVVCINGLSVNIMPTKMITLTANDFLQYTEDNCTPANQIVTAIRKAGAGTGFPTLPNGQPQTSVTFDCNELGQQNVELWAMDLAGNADFCGTYVLVQDNAGHCTSTTGAIAGALNTEAGNGLEDADVELNGSAPTNPTVNLLTSTDDNGQYVFGGVPYAGDYTVTPIKDNDPLNGVSTFDLVLINKHILGLEPLNSPYKMIAADANNSRSITTFDILELRKLILGIYTDLPNNTSWRFVDDAYNFPNLLNPFQELFPETKQVADLQSILLDQDFVAVKVGDVNGNAVTSSLLSTDDRTSATMLFDVSGPPNREGRHGESG
ncbi:MAG: HYR domain-containing protein [Lewinellaceae bacterium]|nr:HYR domain-containing protein [Lewinellaceae bacterium]